MAAAPSDAAGTVGESVTGTAQSFEFVVTELVTDLPGRPSRSKEHRAGEDPPAGRWSAEAADRLRLAREVHDWVGSGVTLALRQLDLHAIDVSRGQASPSRRVNEVRRTLEELLTSTRRLVAELRDVPRVPDLEAALREFVERADVACCEVTVAVHGDESGLPSELRDEVFLIVREAMRNALTHAGADAVRAVVDVRATRLVATVDDDGVGPDGGPSPRRGGGAGLATMRERAEEVGGRLSITRRSPRGTRVQLVVDLPEGWRADAR